MPNPNGTPLPELLPEHFQVLSGLADQGMDPSAVLSTPPPSYQTESTYEEPSEITLSEDNRKLLERDLGGLLAQYWPMMGERNKQEERITNNYFLLEDSQLGGQHEGASQLCSELTMSQVDQGSARVTAMMLDAKPLIRARSIVAGGLAPGETLLRDLAEATERFLNNYAERQVKAPELYDLVNRRTFRVGSTVLLVEWEKKTRRHRFYEKSGGVKKKEKVKEGIKVSMIPNRDAVLWPPWIQDWLEAEIVGHRSMMSKAAWRELAKKLELDKETVEFVERGGDQDQPRNEDMNREGIGSGTLAQEEFQVSITSLWCRRPLPGKSDPSSYHVILHESTNRVLKIFDNPYHCDKHPYRPIRCKRSDLSGWGIGLGHELRKTQDADTVLWNLRTDGILATCYNLVAIREASGSELYLKNPSPGQRVVTENPKEDIHVHTLGAEPDGISEATQDVQYRAARATGVAPVLGGQGDPTMKSGAGTGSTIALIQEAGRKLGLQDRNIRRDWSAVWEFVLELVAQYAPEGIFYEHASEEDAEQLTLLKYVPPQGDLQGMLRITVEAPNADTSFEALKVAYLAVAQFASMQLQMLDQYGSMVLQQENPAELINLKRQIFDFLREMTTRIIQLHSLDELATKVPFLPPATPQDQIINQLTQQLEQANQQLMQLQAQVQALAGQDAAGLAGAGGGEMGEGQVGGSSGPSPIDAGVLQ